MPSATSLRVDQKFKREGDDMTYTVTGQVVAVEQNLFKIPTDHGDIYVGASEQLTLVS